jgi:hypothetical protein
MTNKHIERASGVESIDQYPSTPDWPLIIGTAFMIAFGIVGLIVLF